MNRRAAIAAALALAAHARAGGALSPAGAGDTAGGVVTTELILTETCLALGHGPAAIGNRGLYQRLVGDPAPGAALDLGPLNEPNLELLRRLAPRLILAAAWQQAAAGRLERIAPVEWLQTLPLEGALTTARALADQMARILGRDSGPLLARLEDALTPLGAQRALIVRMLEDGRHMIVFGPGSLPGDVLSAMGLTNAATGSMIWGARSTGLEELVDRDGPAVLAIGGAGSAGPFLDALSFNLADRLRPLPPVFPAGGVASAIRLATAIRAAMA
ncbi:MULTISPECIES: ABC transporter substrate-binding protein [unclassified Haematobacter]|uniref:ABC transporter substrate-binding protein n=1 Tax=unclassified Haematobacter TaxID=2640585 RepID=UPI0025B7BA4B|nr:MULTISPECIES: ABC transporter substrate-binding protein [unclassified Haematobacter]